MIAKVVRGLILIPKKIAMEDGRLAKSLHMQIRDRMLPPGEAHPSNNYRQNPINKALRKYLIALWGTFGNSERVIFIMRDVQTWTYGL